MEKNNSMLSINNKVETNENKIKDFQVKNSVEEYLLNKKRGELSAKLIDVLLS